MRGGRARKGEFRSKLVAVEWGILRSSPWARRKVSLRRVPVAVLSALLLLQKRHSTTGHCCPGPDPQLPARLSDADSPSSLAGKCHRTFPPKSDSYPLQNVGTEVKMQTE
jgi:hypothetical protein